MNVLSTRTYYHEESIHSRFIFSVVRMDMVCIQLYLNPTQLPIVNQVTPSLIYLCVSGQGGQLQLHQSF